MSRPKTMDCPDCEGQGWHKEPDVTGRRVRCHRCCGIGKLSREAVTMGELASYVAGNLPRGWTLKATIEREAGWVSLYNPEGDEVKCGANFESFEEDVILALECALSMQAAADFADKLHGGARVVRAAEEAS
jgi:hypothetical protein